MYSAVSLVNVMTASWLKQLVTSQLVPADSMNSDRLRSLVLSFLGAEKSQYVGTSKK
jgi:hypothetical protein